MTPQAEYAQRFRLRYFVLRGNAARPPRRRSAAGAGIGYLEARTELRHQPLPCKGRRGFRIDYPGRLLSAYLAVRAM